MKDPAEPARELLPAGVVTPGYRISLTNTQGRWLLLFHNPQGQEDPQDFRAEVNSTDFMFSWYLVRVCISQEQKTTEALTTEQFSFVMRYFSLLPHRNPAVLWFKNSRELETKPFYKTQKKIRALVLRSIAGVKSLLHERLQLQIALEKLKRKVSEKAAAGFFRLCCYRCKLKVFERAEQHNVHMEWT